MDMQELATKQDLELLKRDILTALQERSTGSGSTDVRWVRSREMMEILSISASTLQNFRIQRIIPYSKISGTLFYDLREILKILEENRS